jgi:hypothetical protein
VTRLCSYRIPRWQPCWLAMQRRRVATSCKTNRRTLVECPQHWHIVVQPAATGKFSQALTWRYCHSSPHLFLRRLQPGQVTQCRCHSIVSFLAWTQQRWSGMPRKSWMSHFLDDNRFVHNIIELVRCPYCGAPAGNRMLRDQRCTVV